MATKLRRAKFESVSVVLLGAFPPDRFMPDALADAKVISRKDAKSAVLKTLIQGNAVQFQLSWGEFLCTDDRFQVTASEAPYVRACDFVLNALNDLPGKSIVRAFGINVESHFDMGSIQARDALGVRVAPIAPWGNWGEEIQKSMTGPNELHGGVMALQIRKPFSEGNVVGWLDVTVAPSARVKENQGILIRTNHHHATKPRSEEVAQPSDLANSAIEKSHLLLKLLSDRFDESVAKAQSIFADVVGGAA